LGRARSNTTPLRRGGGEKKERSSGRNDVNLPRGEPLLGGTYFFSEERSRGALCSTPSKKNFSQGKREEEELSQGEKREGFGWKILGLRTIGRMEGLRPAKKRDLSKIGAGRAGLHQRGGPF